MNDTRVPIFVVLEEAHNFIPRELRDSAEKALRDQFRTIAAEGRKYHVFLILVSQRPHKLDHLILSEWAKKAIMRLDSTTILQLLRDKLGLQDIGPYVLEKTVQKGQGVNCRPIDYLSSNAIASEDCNCWLLLIRIHVVQLLIRGPPYDD